MIIRPDTTISNFNNTDVTQHNVNPTNIPGQPISGEANTPMTIDGEDGRNNRVEGIKQKIESDKYPIDLDSTSKKMAQELLQK